MFLPHTRYAKINIATLKFIFRVSKIAEYEVSVFPHIFLSPVQNLSPGIMKKLLLVIFLLSSVPLLKAEEKHRFGDRKNVRLHLINRTAQSIDAYSTQRLLNIEGGRESNPLARPLVRHGWKGQAAASYGLGFGGTLLGSYLLHRWGHHKLERITPIFVATPTALAGGLNFRF